MEDVRVHCLTTDPIGAPPPSLGKRKLGTYRDLGRTAAAIMKYVPVPDGDPMPKRGRGCGEGSVVFPRGNSVSRGHTIRTVVIYVCLGALFCSRCLLEMTFCSPRGNPARVGAGCCKIGMRKGIKSEDVSYVRRVF